MPSSVLFFAASAPPARSMTHAWTLHLKLTPGPVYTSICFVVVAYCAPLQYHALWHRPVSDIDHKVYSRLLPLITQLVNQVIVDLRATRVLIRYCCVPNEALMTLQILLMQTLSLQNVVRCAQPNTGQHARGSATHMQRT